MRQGLKSIVNEKFGDGIMSAIDFYLTVDKVSCSYLSRLSPDNETRARAGG